MDATEKTVLQYRSDIDRSDEKLKEIEKVNETETAKLDTELLYVGYMVEKKFQNEEAGQGEPLPRFNFVAIRCHCGQTCYVPVFQRSIGKAMENLSAGKSVV